MTEISFYHLQRDPLEVALPRLLEKILGAGHRAVILAASAERVEHLNSILWSYSDKSFLPHGAQDAGRAERQPLFLTTEEENPAAADILVMVDGVDPQFKKEFLRCLDLFDGRDDDALTFARARWKTAKDDGFEVTYWRQGDAGGWEKAEL
jgi:DNA polymerase-3 subunit chi